MARYNEHVREFAENRATQRSPSYAMICFALVMLAGLNVYFAITIYNLEMKVTDLLRSQSRIYSYIDSRTQSTTSHYGYRPRGTTSVAPTGKPAKKDCWIRDGNSYKQCPPE